MTENEASKVGGVIKGTMKELSSEMSDEDIQNEIISMKKDYFSSEY